MNNAQLLIHVFDRMVGVKRPYGGAGEGGAIAFLMDFVPDSADCWVDAAGNLHVDTRTDDKHRTLFVAHVDTVHRVEGYNDYTVSDDGIYHAPKGSALGADDGAGVSILTVLMQQVPAYYIFCRGEEVGGIGSKFVATNYPDLLTEFDRAIAFDRRGTTDVITHQGGARCASEAFGEALAGALCDQGLLYMPCDTGVYTDTAEFTDIISECTNISCGYMHEHGDRETQDGNYLIALMEAAVALSWDDLPVKRTPGDDDWPRYTGYRGYYAANDRTAKVSDAEMGSLAEFLAGEGAWAGSGGWGGWGDDDDYTGAAIRDEVTALDADGQFPVIVTDEDMEIAEAFVAARYDLPMSLMRLVSRKTGLNAMLIDEDLFSPAEVEFGAKVSTTWGDFLKTLCDDCLVAAHP